MPGAMSQFLFRCFLLLLANQQKCDFLLFGCWSYFVFHVWSCVLELATRQKSQPDEDDVEVLSEYDVFLSFRGPDARQSLADVLYHDMCAAGLCVFRDEEELELGDKIDKILPCIKNSKICVPVLSKTFAASPWCLREVERMVDLDKEIMPILYGITTDEIKLKKGSFKKDLQKHVKKYGKKQVEKWEDALKAVAEIKGRGVKNTGLAEFSTKFIKGLLIKLTVKTEYVTGVLVKRDDQEEHLMKLLGIDEDDERLVIGIHGLGGAGKTTLAKVVFNQISAKFDGRSFLENIQESLNLPKGLQCLQRKLLEDLDPKSKEFREGNLINMLQKKFCKRKVLIVLDDVKERKQVEMIIGALDWFGSGSRIIITTRDDRVFTEEVRALEVHEMDEDQALQLFSRHAFQEDFPPIDYRILSHIAVSLTGRLPLALEVIGSRLYRCEKDTWKAIIRKLKHVLDQGVQGKLQISFDELDHQQKQIFLDITCFFIKKEKSSAMYIWEDCGFYPDEGIKVLISLSLLKITRNDAFWMHDLVRDLGRAIVREKYPDKPVNWSRIWSSTEAMEVVKIKKGKNMVEGLALDERCDSNLTNEEFSSFSKLRLLKLVDTTLAGNFEGLLPQLRYFSWQNCPSAFAATNLFLGKLVVLDLSQSLITGGWVGWTLIKVTKKLKVLDLTNCRNLNSTPDLSGNLALERLILRGCHNLARMHSSIRKLARLRHLDIRGCYSLRGFPDELGSLRNLEEILVEGNGGAFHIPDAICNLRSLSVIKLNKVKITRIPQSIGKLVNLTCLDLRGCRGEILLDAIGGLKSLVKLDLSGTELSALPSTVGKLARLQSLNLQSTKITELPDTMRELKSLEILNLRGSLLRILPNFVGDLESLRQLNLERTKVTALPNCIGRLVQLELLNLSHTKIRELPHTLGYLTSLNRLDVSHTRLRELPISLGSLKSLEILDLRSSPLRTLPDWVGGLSKLKELHLDSCKILKLPGTIGKLTKLRYLSARDCNSLTEVPLEIGDLSSLTTLYLTAPSVAELPPTINALASLKSLSLISHLAELQPEGGATSLDLGPLNLLEELELDCLGVRRVQQLPTALTRLTLIRVTPDTKLPDFSNLKDLRTIQFRDCSLRDVPEWNKLKLVGVSNCQWDPLVQVQATAQQRDPKGAFQSFYYSHPLPAELQYIPSSSLLPFLCDRRVDRPINAGEQSRERRIGDGFLEACEAIHFHTRRLHHHPGP